MCGGLFEYFIKVSTYPVIEEVHHLFSRKNPGIKCVEIGGLFEYFIKVIVFIPLKIPTR